MRVAVVSPGYAPTIGGVERHVTELTRSLHRLGVHVEVWTQQRGLAACRKDVLEDIPVLRFPCTDSQRFPSSPRLWAHARAHAPAFDLLHVHGYHSTASLAALAAPARVPVVFTPHYHGTGHSPLASLLHRPYRLVGARLVRRSAALVAVSAAEQGLLHRDFPRRPPTALVHNAVSEDMVRTVEPMPATVPVILVVGRLEGYKRVEMAMRAFDRLDVAASLVVVGTGPAAAGLEAVRQSLRRRDDIALVGAVPDAALHRWLHTAQVVMSLSEQEAFGIVALEGIAGGAVAVLSDIPAHREVQLLAPDRIWLVEPGNLDRTAAVLRERVLSERALPRLVRSWSDAADELLEVYERTCLRA